MDIRQFNKRVSSESQNLQNLVKQRQSLTGDRGALFEQLIPEQHAILAEAVVERTVFRDNPNRVYWQPSTRIRPQMVHFTQLRYLPFSVSKPDLDIALEAISVDCGTDIRRMIDGYGSAKVWLTIQVRYEPANPLNEKYKTFEFYLSCAPTRFFHRDPTDDGDGAPYAEPLRELGMRIKRLNAQFIRELSGLVLAGILQLVIRGVRYIPLAGRCFRELPPYLKNKKAIINIQNNDERCFGYSLLYFIDPRHDRNNSGRATLYTEQMFEDNQLADLPYPIAPNDVHQYEDRLQTNINVFSFFDEEGKARHPLFISRKHYPRTANLLYWDEHYSPITDIGRLFKDITTHKEPTNMCLRCFGHFKTPETLGKHQRLCTREDFMSVVHVLPAPDTEQAHIKFRQFRNTYPAPFVIYADFESILEPLDRRVKQTLFNQQHKISAACAMLVSNIGAIECQTWVTVGDNALSEFLTQIIDWERICIEHLKNNIQMKRLSRAKQEEYDNATQCHICRKPLLGDTDPKGPKVRDHDHVTGFFIAAAHQSCNLQRRVNYQIPVFFHNFRGYDSHLIVHEFPNIQNRKLQVIGQNMEKYLQIQWGENIVFRDSLMFLTSSLDSLVKSLANNGRHNFTHLHRTLGHVNPDATDEMLQMLEQKGVFCYDYIDKHERLLETKLPPREQFYNRLSGEECSEENYARAQKVWRDFKCGNIGDYMRLYLLCDVALLADVFEKFRNNSLEGYQLDPAYYMSAPQLAWSALLKFIDRPIHLITDPEMYRMIQPNIRGGLCHASVRYAHANNKYMGQLYDPTKPASYILYVDANNLYGWALSQPLPDDEYEWVSANDCLDAMAAFQVKAYRDQWYTREKHYIFEVDMDYPPELHERDDDYPLAPETMTIEAEITGEKQHELRAKYFGAACPFSRKLVCSFLPKRKYVVHGHLLRFYLDRGMKLVKIHRGISFTASPYFEPYIRHNSEKRAQFKTDVDLSNLYKLLNNAIFGKTIENVAKRSDIRLVTDEDEGAPVG